MTRLKLVKKRTKNARLAFTWRFMQRYVVENRNLCEKKFATDLKIMSIVMAVKREHVLNEC